MRDPVVTPSGHSYERAALEHYLRHVKAEDPQSRRPLSADMLAPNLALREAIGAFLPSNPWAHPLLVKDGQGRVVTTGMEGAAAGAAAGAAGGEA
jgi:STIP1 family protein 1